MVRQAVEAVVEVLLEGRKLCCAWVGRRCNCAAENLSEVSMWVVDRPFGKARRVGIAGLDEVNPVANQSVRDACIVGNEGQALQRAWAVCDHAFHCRLIARAENNSVLRK